MILGLGVGGLEIGEDSMPDGGPEGRRHVG
jgi:hypothetical protein